jgi:hypothetical protein
MISIRNSFNLNRLYNLNQICKINFRSFYCKSSILLNKQETNDSNLNETTFNKQNLPVIVKPTLFQRVKESLGFQGGLTYPQPVLTLSSLNLYLCIQYQIDFDKFFIKLNYPDVFYSYCLINFFHVWLLSVPLMNFGRSGLYVRKALHKNMWKDIEARAKKLEASMNKENKLKTYTQLDETFKAFLFGFDEGLLSILFLFNLFFI